LQLHRAALAAQQILEAIAVLDADAAVLESEGGWLRELNAALASHYAEQRDIVLAAARLLAWGWLAEDRTARPPECRLGSSFMNSSLQKLATS
jgi:hypothetical protein